MQNNRQGGSRALRPCTSSTSDAYLDVRASAWGLVSKLAPSPMDLVRGEAQHIAAYLDKFSLRPQFHTQPILTQTERYRTWSMRTGTANVSKNE